MKYDVFLSHNGKDKSDVEQIARRLEDEAHLEPFLDKWHLVPGEPWQEALEQALDGSATCAVFVGPHGLSPWENEEMRAALEKRVARPDYRVIPVLLPGATQPSSLPGFLSRLTWVDFRGPEGLLDENAFQRLVSGVRGTEPGRGGSGGASTASRTTTLVFDAAHGQGEWRHLPPTATLGFRRAAALTGLEVIENRSKLRDLDGYAGLVLSVGPEGRCRLDAGELKEVFRFVQSGKGLLLLGTYTGDWHHEANLNELGESYGITFETYTVLHEGASVGDAYGHLYEFEPSSSRAVTCRPCGEPDVSGHALVEGVTAVKALSACPLEVSQSAATTLLCADGTSSVWKPEPSGRGVAIAGYEAVSRAPVVLAACSKIAKVVAVGSFKMFLDAFVDDASADNRRFFQNVIGWLTR